MAHLSPGSPKDSVSLKPDTRAEAADLAANESDWAASDNCLVYCHTLFLAMRRRMFASDNVTAWRTKGLWAVERVCVDRLLERCGDTIKAPFVEYGANEYPPFGNLTTIRGVLFVTTLRFVGRLSDKRVGGGTI